jgi:hypothetical protein
MDFTRIVALATLIFSGAVAHADDLTPLFPDNASIAMGIDVKAIYDSPLGKKVVGKDKPFDVARNLMAMIFSKNESESFFKSIEPLEPLINRLERISLAGDSSSATVCFFLEGDIGDAELTRTTEAFAELAKLSFNTEKIGDRKMLIVGDRSYAVRVNKSLAVFASSRELLSEILDQHSGNRKAKPQPALLERLKRIKPAESPIWLAMGELKTFNLGIAGSVGTISFDADAEIRLEVSLVSEEKAKDVESVLKEGHELLISWLKEPAKSLWQAADFKAKQDGKMVKVTGKVSGAKLAEEYAKLK